MELQVERVAVDGAEAAVLEGAMEAGAGVGLAALVVSGEADVEAGAAVDGGAGVEAAASALSAEAEVPTFFVFLLAFGGGICSPSFRKFWE